jgi:hypothetical protein
MTVRIATCRCGQLRATCTGVTAIAVGAFADPDFPPPVFSVYEGRKHRWVAITGDDIEHMD